MATKPRHLGYRVSLSHGTREVHAVPTIATTNWWFLNPPQYDAGSCRVATAAAETTLTAPLALHGGPLSADAAFLTSGEPGGASTNGTPVTDDNSDLAMNGPTARATYDVDGTGIKIGILSDSFNELGGMATDIANGDLPAATTIL